MSASRTPKSPAEERANAQRERILDAAKQCFIGRGFHAASMAAIAETAGMSQGLIYRYFPSKDAIILAIMERQLVDSRAAIHALHGAANFEAAVLKVFTDWCSANPRVMNAALFLEISADAARNPELPAAVHASDLAIRDELARWLAAPCSNGGKGLSPELAPARALMLQCFMEGLATRALREPDLDLELLKVAIAGFLSGVFKAGLT